MRRALAHRVESEQPEFCTACSRCEMLLPVAPPAPSTTLLELYCSRCGTSDVYHVNTLRPLTRKQNRQ